MITAFLETILIISIGTTIVTAIAWSLANVLYEKDKLSKEFAAYEREQQIKAIREKFKQLEPKQ